MTRDTRLVTVTMTPGRPPGSPGDGSPAQGITARPRLRAWPRPLGWELAIRAWAPLQYLHVFVCIIAILYVCRMYMSVCVCILNHLGGIIAKYEMSYRMYVACMLYHDSVVTVFKLPQYHVLVFKFRRRRVSGCRRRRWRGSGCTVTVAQ